jgi:hypothetical protein
MLSFCYHLLYILFCITLAATKLCVINNTKVNFATYAVNILRKSHVLLQVLQY